MAGTLHAGWLTKSPTIATVDEKTVKNWRRRWCVLTANQLAYYKDESEGELRGVIEFNEAAISETVKSDSRGFVFAVQCPDRTYFLQAANSSERIVWVTKILDVLSEKPPPSAPPAPPKTNTYTGETLFQVSYLGEWVRLEVRPPRLNLIRTVYRGKPPQPCDMVTDTWPLAGLTDKTYTQAEGVFSFVAGQLDPKPGHVYEFAIQPEIDIVGAIEGFRAGATTKWTGQRAKTIVYRDVGLEGKPASQLNMEQLQDQMSRGGF